jgi:hypothetical protein
VHKEAHERHKAINEKRSQKTNDGISNDIFKIYSFKSNNELFVSYLTGSADSDESQSIHSDDNGADEVVHRTPRAESSFTAKNYHKKKKIERALY